MHTAVNRLLPLLATCPLLSAAAQPLEEPAAAPAESGVSQAFSAPRFAIDPFWPRELPEDWLLGNVVGVATDSSDNVWIIHRPNSQRGAENTPPVIAFDPAGAVVHAWGGPGDGLRLGNADTRHPRRSRGQRLGRVRWRVALRPVEPRHDR